MLSDVSTIAPVPRHLWLTAGYKGIVLKKAKLGIGCDIEALIYLLNNFFVRPNSLDLDIHETEPTEATDGPSQPG